MSRTPFYTPSIKPSGLGATTYTIPAGKFAVCNSFFLFPSAGEPGYVVGNSPVGTMLTLNGDTVCVLGLSGSGRSFGRIGPFIFNAGDVIGNSGPILLTANYSDPTPYLVGFSLVGFLYDQSTKKVPINQKMIPRTTSYTVPAGKHVACMLHPGGRQASVAINSTVVMKIGGALPAVGGLVSNYGFGPLTVASGSVISTDLLSADLSVLANDFGLLSGFLYNNT